MNKSLVIPMALLVMLLGFLPLSTVLGDSDPWNDSMLTQTAMPAPSEEAVIALRYVSRTYNIPQSELKVGDEVIIEYPITGKTLWVAKVVEVPRSIAHLVYVDLDSRQIVDGESIKQLEEKNCREKYSKLDPPLYDRLQTLQDSETVKVSIWLVGVNVEQIRKEVADRYPEARLEDTRATEETPPQLLEKIEAEIREAEKRAYQDREAPVIAFLEGHGFKVKYAAQFAPLVFAELPKTEIQAVAQREDVVRISLSSEGELLSDSANPTNRVNATWARGLDGTDIRVAVVEYDAIDFSHPNLVDGPYFDFNNRIELHHATRVAGVIASTSSTYQGMAYGAQLYSANSGTEQAADIIAAVEWALNQGTHVLNNSYFSTRDGNLDDVARYFDQIALSQGRTVVAAAGNEVNFPVNSPALAYNVIGVGGITDENTPYWKDDAYWDPADGGGHQWGSAFLNPNDGRDKPEVVAVASSVMNTTVNGGFSTAEGTSYASAQVSGLAALLLDQSTSLRDKPWAVKAIIMASAVHNIEDDARLSDRDGAGAIDAGLAEMIVRNQW